MNNLRDARVTPAQHDGGLRNRPCIVMAAMMGAEEYGIGISRPLIAMAVIMVRQCQSNTCPVASVTTKTKALRASSPQRR